MPDVFVNYRTGDEENCAVLIERELSSRFGSERIFRDSKSIRAGREFPRELVTAVRESAVLLAVIGPRWLSFRDRLDDEDDWIRKEIELASESVIPIVPILVGDVERLRRADLPPSIAHLADRQYLKFNSRNAEADLRQIGDKLADLVPGLADRDTPEPAPQQHQGGDTTTTVAGNVYGNVNSVNGTQTYHFGETGR